MIKKGLGKGLGALIPSDNNEEQVLNELRVNDIEPNLHQPRKHFDDDKLLQLSESIKQHGMVQPIIVKKDGDIYRIVAGERRWRAARLAGLIKVPVVIKEYSNRQVMEVALIENLQREDLNAIEEAEAYDKLIKEYEMTQEELSKVVGKSRSAIANSVRLLGLRDEIKEYLVSGELTSGHARALITVENFEIQKKIVDEIIKKNLSVRETETLVKKYLTVKTKRPTENKEEYTEVEERLKSIFGTKVNIVSKNKKGKIMIEYYSNEELDRILELVNKIGKI